MKLLIRTLLGLSLILTTLPAISQSANRSLVEGTGQVVTLSRPASSIFVGDPGVADVRVVSGTALFLAGISPGTTNVFALDFEDQLIASYTVRVVADNAEARATIGSAVPNGSIQIRSNEGAAILRGRANSLNEALAALDARRSLEANDRLVVDRTTIKNGTQVSLKVRFVEASRSDLRQLGFDLSALGSVNGNPLRLLTGDGIAADFLNGTTGLGGNGLRAGVRTSDVDAVLSALDERGVVEILSEPTLTTTSGRRANFRAGGEFGFPVPQGDGVIGVEYREFGVSLDFLPTVLPNNRIALEVSPEVSFIDPEIGVDVDGFVTPSLSVRRAETTVEVGSGQTFAIAGLYEQFESDSNRGVPGLSNAPVVGRLFGRETRRRDERELVIFITPFLAEASDIAEPNRPDKPKLVDSVGFIVK
ncbi:MAG: pilus assembly protein N-terminal domain-containing protein [Pseudomonadota bacterium]